MSALPTRRPALRTGRLHRPAPGTALLLVGAAAGLLFVLFSYGLLPGQVNDMATNTLTEGAIRCTNDLGLSAFWSRCHDFGEPLGFPLLTGGPWIALGALFMVVPGVGSYPAYLLSGAVLTAVAMAGGFGLMRRLGAGPWVALGTAIVYLVSPTVMGLAAFGGTFYGFALLPAYGYVQLLAMDAIERGGRRTLWLAALGLTFVQTAALFMDGYSFVAGNLLAAALWLGWGLRGRPGRQRLLGAALFLGANAVAAAVYLLYVPGVYEQNPIGIFRSMGLDLSTLVLPSRLVWVPHELGLDTNHLLLWGDSSNSYYNYAGFACVILAIVAAVWLRRRPFVAALAIAGLVALALSLGPSLKIDDARPTASGRPTFDAYLMPEGVATADLPWGGLFTAIPGVDDMRATYRWFGVTRLVLIILAGLAVAELARRRNRRAIAAVVALVAVAELLPTLSTLSDAYRNQRADTVALRSEVRNDLDATTQPGERAFFLNYDGTHNDFLANYLAASADLRAYNAGGDKNSLLAAAHWPPEVGALSVPGVGADAVAGALESGAVDVVVAPYFHLRWSAYSWPPAPEERAQAEQTFAPMLGDPRLEVERRAWLATIRLAD